MLKGRRTESPSSINIYKQCPRKYYYLYVEKLSTRESIHLIRGSVVHKVLEDFYDMSIGQNNESFKFLHMRTLSLFTRYWKEAKDELKTLNLTEKELEKYFDESVFMLQNWFNRFKQKMLTRMEKSASFAQAFRDIKPLCEELYKSEEFMIKGYIDAIHNIDDKVILMDYKTSKKDTITDQYRLQLAIYAFLYEQTHGTRPHYVGIDFLKSMQKLLPVTDDLIKHAQFEIEQIHASTPSNDINDFPLKPSPLCKWKTGQCDFYEICFKKMKVEEYKQKYPKKPYVKR